MSGEILKHSNGYLKYNESIHENHGKPWLTSEIKLLKDWYKSRRVEDIAMALGRTAKTVANKAYQLRKEGDL